MISNCQKEVKSQTTSKVQAYSTNLSLSSLASEFLQRIQIKEFFFCGGRVGGRLEPRVGGGGGGGGGQGAAKM